MRIALVVAMAEGGVIGDKGKLPWRISDDLKWFKKVTLGKPVIMGRKTFDSIGKPLPGRINIVITRSNSWNADGVLIAPDVAQAIEIAAAQAVKSGADEMCIIGGGEIFAQTLALADRIYLTRVKAPVAGDAYFPQIAGDDWFETQAGACEKSPRNEFSCEFSILDRRGEH
jgi:dihydrofolate reductase